MAEKFLKDWTAQDGVPTSRAGTIVDATARAAGTVTAETLRTVTSLDIGKDFEQLSDGTYWRLKAVSPSIVWLQLGGNSVTISTNAPQALGTASAGSTGQVSDAGHVHRLPTAAVLADMV